MRNSVSRAQIRQALRNMTAGSPWEVAPEEANRKIQGHPFQAATMYVTEVLSQFHLNADTKMLVSRMNREAGYGQHGIIDGTINVEVTFRPPRGMAQVIEVPVTVKNGYMIEPGVFYSHGQPLIICQSALDDVMKEVVYDAGTKPDKKTMFSMR